jgi:hypothetical protein
MLNAPTDLHRSQQLLQDSERLMKRVHMCLEQSEKLLSRGETRATARTRAAVTSDEIIHESTVSHASPCESL